MRREQQDLIEALKEAENAFDNELSSRGLDPAYFDLELEGWVLDTYEFNPMGRSIKIKARHKTETGDDNSEE